MVVRLGTWEDLEEIRALYRRVTARLGDINIPIWNDIYPFSEFETDISLSRLYLLEEDGVLLGSFALTEHCEGENAVEWTDGGRKPLYLWRLAIDVPYLGRGLGKYLCEKALEVTREKGYDSMRFFVVDYNTPALRFYEKLGYKYARGMFVGSVDGVNVLREWGLGKHVDALNRALLERKEQ